MRKIFAFLMALLPLQMMAADYVDAINTSSTKYEAGHQVIYEMNVGSFTAAGTLAAAQQKLGDLKTLGVDIVWLMPIYPRGSSKSPYAVMNFDDVNSNYGTKNDLKNFVAAAHEKNIMVILDWVPNHTANEHPWRTSHPSWYNGEHSYPDISDLNYDNADLKAEMLRIMKGWIDCGVDGFRFDFVTNTKPSYWMSTNASLKEYAASKGKSDIVLLAEIDTNDNQRFSNKTNNIGFTHDYAWWLQETVLRNGFGKNKNVSTLKSNLEKFLTDSPALNLSRMVYLTSHDQNWNDGGATLADMYGDSRYALTALAFTLYGTPMIYNGQEIGGSQKLDYFNDTKVNWNSVDNKMKNTVRTLTALKHWAGALEDAVKVNWLNTGNNNVLAYTRKAGDNEVLVILNLSTSDATVTLSVTAGEWSQWLDSKTIRNGVNRTSVSFTASKSFTIEGNGYQVYTRGTTSGIRTITTPRSVDGRIYTLSGHQVKDKNSLRPGIYIQNGKKFIVK